MRYWQDTKTGEVFRTVYEIAKQPHLKEISLEEYLRVLDENAFARHIGKL